MAIFSLSVRVLTMPCLLGAASLHAAAFPQGHVSQAVGNVHITQSGGPSVVGRAGFPVHDTIVETGGKSRAEVTFADGAVVRLGDNTKFGFGSATRDLSLTFGASLIQVPSGVGRTQLQVHGITATATGTTLIVESLPNTYTKFIVLDGTSRLCLRTGGLGSDCVLLRPGQMLIAAAQAKALPEAVDVDLGHLIDTCQLITQFQPLPGAHRLAKAAKIQRRRKSHGNFVDTGLTIFGRGTVVSRYANEVPQPGARPSAPPKEQTPGGQ